MILDVAVIIWLLGFVLLVYGSTCYPLRLEYTSEDEFRAKDRRSKTARFAGGALIVVGLLIGWLA